MELVVWLLMATAGYYVARWRGHNPWIGFFVVLFFSLIGLILVAIVPPKHKKEKADG